MPIKIGDFEGEFDDAVAHVKRTKPNITDPEAYVASIMHRQEGIREQIELFGQEFPDFDSAVNFVRTQHPEIANPEGYVSSIFKRGKFTEEKKQYTPEEAGYVRSITPRKCATCEYFQYPSICNLPIVKDGKTFPVDPELDCCNHWEPKDKSEGDIIYLGKTREAHTSTSYYGQNMNVELDEDSYLKQALSYLSAAVKAHNLENQRPEMEQVENDYLLAAKDMFDKAIRVHFNETKTLETTTLDDIPTPTHGSSQSSATIPFYGKYNNAHVIWAIVRQYIEFKNRGIPDAEALRAIAMEFGPRFPTGGVGDSGYEPRRIPNPPSGSPMAPQNTQYWPLRKTGAMDNVDRIYPNLIPSGPFSPALPSPDIDPPRLESVAISGNLNAVSVGGKKMEQSISLEGGIASQFPKLPPMLDNLNYGSASGNNNPEMQTSMHGETPFLVSKQIPEESYYSPMNKSWSKQKQGIPPQTNVISSQLAYGDSSFGPQDHQPGESEAIVPRDQILPYSGNDVIEPSTKEQVGYPPMKLRQMGKFHYVGHGHLSKHQERKGMHVCEMLNGSVWEMSDVRRPIVPSEGAGITNTHPNCRCYWEYFTEIDSDPLAYAMIRQPTLHDKPLSDFNWKGRAIDHIEKINNHINSKYQQGRLHQLNRDGSVGSLMECSCGCKKHKILNQVKKLRESLNDEFAWLTPEYRKRIKDMESEAGGKFYLVRASAETITDHRSEGEPYRRKLDAEELWATARTGVGKGTDINHDPRYKTEGYVVDGDFDPQRREIQYLVHESDPEIIAAIDNGTISAVSINGGAPRSEFVAPCDSNCEHQSGECELCLHPRGVILGEQDNIAFTWVVTNPNGMEWRGTHMNAASPGVKVTKIEAL